MEMEAAVLCCCFWRMIVDTVVVVVVGGGGGSSTASVEPALSICVWVWVGGSVTTNGVVFLGHTKKDTHTRWWRRGKSRDMYHTHYIYIYNPIIWIRSKLKVFRFFVCLYSTVVIVGMSKTDLCIR